MLWALRHLLAIAVLPFTVAVVVPVWLARRNGIARHVPRLLPRWRPG